jgi:hypothetical protein
MSTNQHPGYAVLATQHRGVPRRHFILDRYPRRHNPDIHADPYTTRLMVRGLMCRPW